MFSGREINHSCPNLILSKANSGECRYYDNIVIECPKNCPGFIKFQPNELFETIFTGEL